MIDSVSSFEKKTNRISSTPSTKDPFKELQSLILNHFNQSYYNLNKRLDKLFSSPEELEQALKLEATRNYSKDQSPSHCSCSTSSTSTCNSCQSTDSFDELTQQANHHIQASIEYAQTLKVLDAKENRIAYYKIAQALDYYGSRASAGVRYNASGEMVFYDYLLHFLQAFNVLDKKTQDIIHLEDHQRYLKAVKELTETIILAINEGELIASSMLIIRLADTFLFATPYIMKSFGQESAAPLMDFAQSLLILSHDMASLVEAPGQMLQ